MEQNINTQDTNEEQPVQEPAHPDQGPDVEPNPDPAPGETYVSNQPEAEVTVNENAQPEKPEEPVQEPAHPDQGPDVEPQPMPPTTEQPAVEPPEEPVQEPAHPDQGPDVEPNPDPAPGETYVGEDGVVVKNPNVFPEEHTETTELQPDHEALPDTGAEHLPALGVLGGTALALGAVITKFKNKREQRQ